MKIRDILFSLPGRPQKEFIVNETDWYDRILFALEWLCRRPGVTELRVVVDDGLLVYKGNDPRVQAFFLKHGQKAPQGTEPAGWAYAFLGVKDAEYLRRLNEYPDETLQADLEAPFTICSEETSSFITINADFQFPDK